MTVEVWEGMVEEAVGLIVDVGLTVRVLVGVVPGKMVGEREEVLVGVVPDDGVTVDVTVCPTAKVMQMESNNACNRIALNARQRWE